MMSTTLGEEIQKVISKALPGLLEEKKEQLLQRLLSWGVESTDDLKYVEGAPGVDLSDLLPAHPDSQTARQLYERLFLHSVYV